MRRGLRRRSIRGPAFGMASIRHTMRPASDPERWQLELPRGHAPRGVGGRRRTTVAVIIPTFKRPEMLMNLLLSLRDGKRIPDEVIVVDNDPEGSANPAEIAGLQVQVVHAGLGISLSGARNVGWRLAQSDLCIFIDDDNEVEPEAVSEMEEALRDPGVGLVGPVIFAGESGTVWCAGISRSPWTGQTRCILGGESTMPVATSWPTDDMPDAFAIPRDVLQATGGFDEKRFPIHYDEADLCARIRGLGLRSIVARDARVRHYGWVGLSPGSAMVRATTHHGIERGKQMVLSRIRFHFTHSTAPQKLSTFAVCLPIWAILTSLGCLRADETWAVRLETVWAVFTGMVAGYRESLEALTKRAIKIPGT